MIDQIAIFPPQASTTAQHVDLLLLFLVVVCASVGLLVAALLIYFAVRYRRRVGDAGPPAATRQSRLLEWSWTIAPMGIFAIMFLWGAQVYVRAFYAPDDALPIYVVAKQWMWKFQHPTGQREINTLHVPVGQPVKLLLTSEDVIHSFFTPAFRLHMDVLPDRYSSAWFEATRRGEYHLFCSQFCGTSHAMMVGKVIAMEPAEYQAWLTTKAEGSLALQGRKVFLEHRCLSCHSADDDARGPVLETLYRKPVHLRDGSAAIADEQYLRESILHPGAKVVAGYENIMPTFAGLVSAEEVNALIAFLESLDAGATPHRVESFPPPVRNEGNATPTSQTPGAEVPQS
jgi:cytochrome c oxidase subunit 2